MIESSPPVRAPLTAAQSTRNQPRRSLFWRLLPSYLVIIGVATCVAFVAGQAFAPVFLRRHVDAMVMQLGLTMSTAELRAMTADLNTEYRHALTQSLTWASVAAAVATAAVGLFVTRRIVTPLQAMGRASRDIAGGRYEKRLDEAAPGEIGDLADAFNRMAETLAHSEERRVALLADVSREFRTPLTNLRGYLEGLEDGIFKLQDGIAVSACKRQLQRLERLVGDLALLSQVESGVVSLHPQQVDARTLVESSAHAFRPAFDAAEVALVLEVPDHPVWVRADPERCEQVLANLLSNALRHTPRQGTVTVAVQDPPRGRNHATFSVRDTGSGIAPDDLPHVFTRFYRATTSPRTSGGSGIGLTIARHLVERHGGAMGVESTPGHGARFWFSLAAAAHQGAVERV